LSFSANGLVFADRTPYPYLWEVKNVQQNIGFNSNEITAGKSSLAINIILLVCRVSV
jgi:beta-galactosidase